jgi:hypothetical protein
MSTDDHLSQALTELLRGVDGVIDVFDAHPAVESTVRAVAAELDWADSTGLVHVARSEGLVTVTAHVATDLDGSTPEILGRAAEALRARLESAEGDQTLVTVTAHLVDRPAADHPA